MSKEKFQDDCSGCLPAILKQNEDGSFSRLPNDSPEMKAVMELWATTTMEERQAFHSFTRLNSRDAGVLAIIDRLNSLMTLRLRRDGPKISSHPSIGIKCPACGVQFRSGDFTTLIPLGPGSSSSRRRACREGLEFNAVAIEVHWACATGLEV